MSTSCPSHARAVALTKVHIFRRHEALGKKKGHGTRELMKPLFARIPQKQQASGSPRVARQHGEGVDRLRDVL